MAKKKQLNHIAQKSTNITFCGEPVQKDSIDLSIDSCSICLAYLLDLTNTYATFQRTVADAFDEGHGLYREWVGTLPENIQKELSPDEE